MRVMTKLAMAGLAVAGAFSMAMTAGAQNRGDDNRVSYREVLEQAPESAWRDLDPENTVYMDLPSGRIVIELRPDLAPGHVERIRTLTRQGFYNGTVFHRVIEGFMAQGGDPTATGTGGSNLPNLKGEFFQPFTENKGFVHVGRNRRDSNIGFIGPIPVATQPQTLSDFLVDDTTVMWGMHCEGVMSMARSGDPNSANSQFFLMFGDSRRSLDQRYTVWGRIVDGFENARRINRGEPPERPTPITRMRIAADLPAAEREDIRVLRTDTPTFMSYLKAANAVGPDGYVDNVCAIPIPKKVNGELEL